MPIGVVRFYLPQKKYGFLVDEHGNDYFFHFSEILVDFDPSRINKPLLDKGDFVSFEIGKYDNKDLAIKIKRLTEIKQ